MAAAEPEPTRTVSVRLSVEDTDTLLRAAPTASSPGSASPGSLRWTGCWPGSWRVTESGTSFSDLHAVVQAWQPMQRVWSMTNQVSLIPSQSAVAGSTFAQTESWPWEAFVLAVPVGLLAAAILVVNNVRDLETDRRAGKRTLAVRLGRERTRTLYVALMTDTPEGTAKVRLHRLRKRLRSDLEP